MGISLVGLATAGLLERWIKGKGIGPEEMQVVSNAIKEGAEAFIHRQFKTIILAAACVAAVLFVGYGLARRHYEFDPVNTPLALAFWITLSFVLGASCALVTGYIGMWVSIRSNIRAATGTLKNVSEGFQIALRGGAVSGLMVVSMSLLGVAGLYALATYTTAVGPARILFLIVGYGFGASFVALFAQLGGGIYARAADIGAGLASLAEAGIPGGDPRNPAVIAGLVGDNVVDCAGRGADLFESAAAENIGAMILGAVMAAKVPDADPAWVTGVMMFPLLARAFGIIASITGILLVKAKGDEDPLKALNRGCFVTMALVMAGFFVACRLLLRHPGAPRGWLYFFFAGLIGILASAALVTITSYYTGSNHRPTRSIVEASRTGPATNIIAGLAVAFESTALPALVICVAIISAYCLGAVSGFTDGGLFGIAVAAAGMLGPAAYILAMNTFGSITGNAGGIIEMSRQSRDIRMRAGRLATAGNATRALTRGYAIGSAALAAFLLSSAYLDEVRNYGLNLRSVDIAMPAVFAGALLGAMLVFLFSGLAIRAVGQAAHRVIKDVRAQFMEKPGILEGKEKPDYGRCVDIVARGALREMILPGLLAVLMPVSVGFVFRLLGIGAQTVAAMLMAGTITGILLATFLNNGGHAWDNARKYIEMGHYGGKGSESHKAAVTGGTVGDLLKDTAGPSLPVLIKLLSTITLVLAPFFI